MQPVAKLDELMDADYLNGVKISRIIQLRKWLLKALLKRRTHNADLILLWDLMEQMVSKRCLSDSNTEKVVEI